MSEPAADPRHHLFITGTGRAGTSFLVRYLSALGLDTHLTRHPDPRWHEAANAGLENIPIGRNVPGLPYVVKTPWLSELIGDVLANPAIIVDAVIVPVRDLADAAASRVINEQRAIHAAVPWMAEVSASTENWGVTPGGVVFSLNPVDQGRLLAVWFHQLVLQLVRAEVPVVFLDFPRLAQDGAYLFEKLRHLLPQGTTAEQALRAHADIADPAKIRVEDERRLESETQAQPGVTYESREGIDRIAIRRELTRLHGEVARQTAEIAELRAQLAAVQR